MSKLSKEEFINFVKDAFEKDGLSVQIQDSAKTNISGKTFVICGVDGKELKVCPVIYVDVIYAHYEESEDELDEIVADTIGAIRRAAEDAKNIEVKDFTDYEKVKDSLCIKAVNKAKNIETFCDHHYIIRESMEMPSVMFSAIILDNVTPDSRAIVTISNELLNTWGISEQELFKQAMKNMRKNLYSESMLSMLNTLAPELMAQVPEADDENPKMYVITNTVKSYGAGIMYDVETLKNLARTIDANSFYVLPSSMHEIIVLPTLPNTFIEDDESVIREYLYDMVCEVNGTISDADFLADALFYFDGETLREVRSGILDSAFAM